MEETYWLAKGKDVSGPYTFDILVLMWDRKEITITDHICLNGKEAWIEVSRVVKSLETAKNSKNHFQTSESDPDAFFGILIVTIFLPIVGIVVGIIWIAGGKYQSSGIKL